MGCIPWLPLFLHFYPRSPCGERLAQLYSILCCDNISIHALLAESDRNSQNIKRRHKISIHALLAESDAPQPPQGESSIKISIHALLAESDFTSVVSSAGTTGFLSTLSLRRATLRQNYECFQWIISIHALLAESDSLRLPTWAATVISIHALLAESDDKRHSTRYISSHISIHALLAESDTILIHIRQY